MEQNDIRPLTRMQSALFVAGGVLMVAGMGCFVLIRTPQWAQIARLWAAVAYLAGAVLFAVLQIMQSYRGGDFVIKRLKNIMTMADLLFVLAGVLMIDTCTEFLRQLFSNPVNYFNYLYNKWLVVLLVAVVLELYSVNRISYKLRK
ncbi:MAG: hypothetical protein LUI08_04215 [Prevotella sp.]|nr:hypothetical protein [Prevotella sp.]MCD8289147.1 hypothetical protein [Prevotella sp.]MCD8306509.1 hypothetical protein [Prevotella sp.]